MSNNPLYVAYYRVSTAKQGQSGLGLEAQEAAIRDALSRNGGKLIHAYTEVESGKVNDRPQLALALAHAKRRNATLIIAKLDRLSRNAAFLLSLKDAGVNFLALDLPECNTLTLGVMASVAQFEREKISERTKAALAAKKAQGKVLGCPKGVDRFSPEARAMGVVESRKARKAKATAMAGNYAGLFAALRNEGHSSASAIARELNRMGEPTPRGGQWQPVQVIRIMARISA